MTSTNNEPHIVLKYFLFQILVFFNLFFLLVIPGICAVSSKKKGKSYDTLVGSLCHWNGLVIHIRDPITQMVVVWRYGRDILELISFSTIRFHSTWVVICYALVSQSEGPSRVWSLFFSGKWKKQKSIQTKARGLVLVYSGSIFSLSNGCDDIVHVYNIYMSV